MTDWLIGKATYVSTWLGLKVGCAATRCFPRSTLALADPLAFLCFRLFRGFRRRSVSNICAAFNGRIKRADAEVTVQRTLRNFFRACVELVMAVGASDEELRRSIDLVGREHLDRALDKGKGVLILSAHLGNFFLVGTRLTVAGYRASVLINQPREGSFAELLDDYRLRVRQRTIHARPRRQALRELSEALRRNEVAVIIADEYRRNEGVEVTLFGQTVHARRGPVTLALRTGAAVVPASLIRRPDDSLQMIIEPELQLARDAKGKETIRENTILMTQWLERSVRQYPDQWNWMNLRRSESTEGNGLTEASRN